MQIHLPADLEAPVRSMVRGGLYASEEVVVAEAVRSFLRARPVAADPGLGSIGSMRDAADELDQVVEEAMRLRAQAWRPPPDE